MSPWRSANPAVVKFRRVQFLSLALRLTVLLLAVYLVLHFVKGA
jgi:hypothetical protein